MDGGGWDERQWQCSCRRRPGRLPRRAGVVGGVCGAGAEAWKSDDFLARKPVERALCPPPTPLAAHCTKPLLCSFKLGRSLESSGALGRAWRTRGGRTKKRGGRSQEWRAWAAAAAAVGAGRRPPPLPCGGRPRRPSSRLADRIFLLAAGMLWLCPWRVPTWPGERERERGLRAAGATAPHSLPLSCPLPGPAPCLLTHGRGNTQGPGPPTGRLSGRCLGRPWRRCGVETDSPSFAFSRSAWAAAARLLRAHTRLSPPLPPHPQGYIGEFEFVDDHRAGKIVVELNGR